MATCPGLGYLAHSIEAHVMTAATPLPCPSCGTPEPNLIWYANGRYVAVCRTRLCLRTAIMPSKAAAIARWNTRAPIPTAPQEPPTDAVIGGSSTVVRWLGDAFREDSK